MALKLDERENQGYDGDSDARYNPSGDGWQPSGWNADNSEYDEADPSSKASKNKKSSLGEAENSPEGGNSSLANTKEQLLSQAAGVMNERLGKGYVGMGATAATPVGRVAAVLAILKKRKVIAGGMGGGIFGTLAIVILMSGSLGLVNINQSLQGEGNFVNRAIGYSHQQRRMNSFSKIMTDAFKKGAQTELTKQTKAKFQKAGFEVIDERGAIKALKKDGVELVFDGSNKRLARDIAQLTGGSEAERAFIRSFDGVAQESVSRFSGIVTQQKVWQRLGFVQLFDWIGAARVKADTAADGNHRRVLFQASQEQKYLQTELRKSVEAGRIDVDDKGQPTKQAIEVSDELEQKGQEASKKAADSGYEEVIVGSEKDAAGVADNADEVVDVLNKGEDATQAAASRLGGKIGGTFLAALGSVDTTTPMRIACDTRGQLQFVKNVRNVFMAIELAKFAVNFHTIADHQRAGLLEESSLKLMSLYAAGMTGSSSFQWAINGGRTAVATTAIEKYGVGYADVGILAAIASFVNAIPGINPSTCEFVQNPLTQVGGTIVGGFIALASFGVVPGVKLGLSIGLTVSYEVVKTVATPLMIRAVGGLVIDYYEDRIEAGDALVAADGVLKGMTGNANGGLGASTEFFAAQTAQANAIYEEQIAQRSFFERYLDTTSPDSLITKMAFASPPVPEALGQKIKTFAANPFGGTIDVATTLSGSRDDIVYAEEQCTDSATVKYNIATDPFCNPIFSYAPVLDLENTENILKEHGYLAGGGEPQGEFADFVENCFSGRTGVFHPTEVEKDGSSPDDDPTCVVGVNDEILDGEVPELFAGMSANDDRNWFAKFFSPRASAQTQDVERLPTKKERFGAWYGYLADRDNMTRQLTDNYGDAGGGAVNSNIFFLGDSLTAGMQFLGGADEQGNYLERTFEEAGWKSAKANAQSCRSVYQSPGVTGQGNFCPDNLVDGLTAVSQDSFLNNDNAGVVVIGLGTNGQEFGADGQVDNNLFLDKSRELIAAIRAKSPSAKIYWTNLSSADGTQGRHAIRNGLLSTLAAETNIELLDWNGYVREAEATEDPTDDATFVDNVHHNAQGYMNKVKYLLEQIPLPAGAFGGDLDCSGYTEVTAPTTSFRVNYSAEIAAACEERAAECASGVTDTRKILCSAFEFDGVYYGNSYGSKAGPKAIPLYGFNASSGNYGIAAESWLANRSEGLSPNNLLECSGLTSVALFKAYNAGSPGCSGNWTERNRPDMFRQLSPEEIQPGDFLTLTFGCNSGGSGHIAIAASGVDAEGNIIVYETNSWGKPVRFTKKNLAADFPAGRSRYIGSGAP